MKIRIKTKDEMRKDKKIGWDRVNDCPVGWNMNGEMDYLYGKVTEVIRKAFGYYVVKNENPEVPSVNDWYVEPVWVSKVIK